MRIFQIWSNAPYDGRLKQNKSKDGGSRIVDPRIVKEYRRAQDNASESFGKFLKNLEDKVDKLSEETPLLNKEQQNKHVMAEGEEEIPDSGCGRGNPVELNLEP